MNILILLIFGLATFRIANLIAYEIGLFNIFEKLRRSVGVRYNEHGVEYGTNELSKAILCLWCNSTIIGLLITLLYLAFKDIVVYVCLPFALSAIAVIIKEKGTSDG